MPEIISNVPRLIGKLLIWRAILYVGGTVVSAMLAALTGLDWATANNQTRFMVTLGVVGVICGTIGAFIDQSAQRIAKGELPFADIPNGATQATPTVAGAIQKTETHTESKTTTTIPPAEQTT